MLQGLLFCLYSLDKLLLPPSPLGDRYQQAYHIEDQRAGYKLLKSQRIEEQDTGYRILVQDITYQANDRIAGSHIYLKHGNLNEKLKLNKETVSPHLEEKAVVSSQQ